ncbi:MAG: recombination protein RecR [Phycisphaeraceae bacterium]|nr:recombination protein RecR [Phycisphaeraceae bacterium]
MDRLIRELTNLPGIGRRGAERIAFHLLKAERNGALALARAIADVKDKLRHCNVCYNLTDEPVCAICSDPNRDQSTVLVVEQPRDLIALEQTGMYKGIYHVLMGRLSPIEGIGPSDLTIDELTKRISQPARNAGSVEVREIILGLNPTFEGDGTALYIADHITKSNAQNVRITRLARGLPSGSSLEFANAAVLADAIAGRQTVGQSGSDPHTP